MTGLFSKPDEEEIVAVLGANRGDILSKWDIARHISANRRKGRLGTLLLRFILFYHLQKISLRRVPGVYRDTLR